MSLWKVFGSFRIDLERLRVGRSAMLIVDFVSKDLVLVLMFSLEFYP